MAKPDNLEDDMIMPEMTFKQVYPDPVIHDRYKSSIKGVEVWAVYDKSQLAEDPVGISHWIVAGRKKFRAHIEGVQRALPHIKFEPRTDAQALEAALLEFRADDNNVIFLKEPFPTVDAPSEAVSQVKPPDVKKKGDKYVVTFYVYSCDCNLRWFGQDIRSVNRYTAEVGKDHFYMRMPEKIWEPEPMPGFTAPKLVKLTKPKITKPKK